MSGTDDAVASRPRKRLAVFAGAYNHIADGVALTLNNLVDYLERQEIPVRVFAPTVEDPALDHAGTLVPVPSVPFPGRSEYQCSLGLTPSLRAELREFNPTLFQISTPDLLGLQALYYARSRDIPVAGTYHTHFASYLKYYHLDLLEPVVWAYLRHFYQRCDHVYVPTRAVMDVLRRRGIEDGMRLWQRSVDTERFHPARRSMTWRDAHGIGEQEVVVAFVSRLVWEKGLDTYAEVVERLEQEGVPHRSLVVGDGPAREELEDRLPNTVFTGYLRGDELARAYASADVFLFPSDTETFGKVTLEAMASGLPTVCADAAGSRDLVREGETGCLCPPGDADSFTDCVRQLVRDGARRERMGTAAFERAQAFARDKIMAQVVRHYDEILGIRDEPSASDAPRDSSAHLTEQKG
ncbi:MAG: glycosyltransferase family 4 protein [Salinibacter sp.]|uniref:glycosyltransferase family 4 protein n=1 Tax=Salinibacter sp. TaxID=2065818 RepID=UPI0035D4B28E